MAHLYKSRLQNYAQKRNISFPMYSCETQGPPHNRLFKAHVTIDGNTYHGPEFCTTLKDAEHAAAKVALTSLSPDDTQEDDCLYKSLLQELAQKKGLVLPVYATNRTGQPHTPFFASTVQIAGECYVGEEARTKKQAEMNAAKVAYTALTEGAPRTSNAPAFSNIQVVGASSFGSPSLQTSVTREPTVVPTAMLTTFNDQASCSNVKEFENTKGYAELEALQDVINKHTITLSPVAIHQPQPNTPPDVVGLAGEGSGPNDKRNKSPLNEPTSNPIMDSDSARPHSTKIVIRPHVRGMNYDGPIQVSDDEWVAMKVNVYEET